jgi:cardiolipin synthase
MTSNKSDHFYLDPAAHSYFSDLLRIGVKIYLHKNKFVHAKTLVCDDYLSVIGSTNMDFRSFEYLFEINSYLYDEEIAKQNKQIFLCDLQECDEILLEEWEKR